MRKGAPITGATNQRYIWFVSVSDKTKCQNWRYLDFISQMRTMFLGDIWMPIQDQDLFDKFIKENKYKYKAHIYET